MKDRDGRDVSVFALNYGLCQKNSIEFGRPAEKRIYRTYLMERIFDYTPILKQYMKNNQEIKCDKCAASFEIGDLKSIQFFNMKCRTCLVGTCQVINLSRKYAHIIESVGPNLLLPSSDMGILQTLRQEGKPLHARDIAEDQDCSYQLVGKRGKILDDKGLVKRSKNNQGKRLFEITEEAEENYFEQDNLLEIRIED